MDEFLRFWRNRFFLKKEEAPKAVIYIVYGAQIYFVIAQLKFTEELKGGLLGFSMKSA